MADTSTVGGVISGYCAIGNARYAITPARKTTIDSTEAKIGRLIKKLENTAVSLLGCPLSVVRRVERVRRVGRVFEAHRTVSLLWQRARRIGGPRRLDPPYGASLEYPARSVGAG